MFGAPSERPTTKSQLPRNFQFPTANLARRLGIGSWRFLGSWDLEIGSCRVGSPPSRARRQKPRVGRVVDFPLIRVAERLEEAPELGFLIVRHLEADEDAAEVGAVVAVVEQADVPAAAERVEELGEGARPL